MNKRMSVLCLLLIGSLLVVTGSAQIPDLTIKCTDVKSVKGAKQTDSYAINNKNVIAGDYIDSAGVQHGMLLAGTKVTSFDGPTGSSGIAAYGINSKNLAVGWYVDSAGVITGFMYASGKLTTVMYPGSTGTEANGVNDKGWVVGQYFDSANVSHGFWWDTKKFHTLDIPGASYTVAWAINNSNLMTAYDVDTTTGYPLDGYTTDGKTFTKVDPPNSTGTAIHGINNKGDLDYTIFDASKNRHGVLYQKATGVYTQFDDPKGVNTTRADGINDKDAMDGRYSPTTGGNVGFKCTVK